MVKGQKLWFVHSIRLPTAATAERFQAQEVSVSFKAPVKKEFDWKGAAVTILSHFSEPITKRVCVESNVSCNLVRLHACALDTAYTQPSYRVFGKGNFSSVPSNIFGIQNL